MYEVEEDIQYDIEEMEHAIEVMTVEDISFDELGVFAATIQKMGKGASEYAPERGKLSEMAKSIEDFNQVPLDTTEQQSPWMAS